MNNFEALGVLAESVKDTLGGLLWDHQEVLDLYEESDGVEATLFDVLQSGEVLEKRSARVVEAYLTVAGLVLKDAVEWKESMF